jgi:Beta-lactamase
MAVREIKCCVLFITILIAPAASSGPVFGDEPLASLPADFTARIDDLFAKWNHRDSPGCAVGIVHRGQVINSKGFGSADLEYQAPNTPETGFEVMAVSQSLTCVCLAMLLDEGRISPEDDLREFVPEMHPFDPPIRIQDMVRDLCRWVQNFAHNRLPQGNYLDEFFREGTLLGNRSCLDADAALKENDPEARRKSPPGQYRGLRRRQFTRGAWGINAAMSQFPDSSSSRGPWPDRLGL